MRSAIRSSAWGFVGWVCDQPELLGALGGESGVAERGAADPLEGSAGCGVRLVHVDAVGLEGTFGHGE